MEGIRPPFASSWRLQCHFSLRPVGIVLTWSSA